MRMDLDGIDHVALSVADLARSTQWYIDVLGFERRFEDRWDGIPVFIGKGATALALFPLEAKTPPSCSAPPGPRLLHLAFRATGPNFRIAQEELRRRGISFQVEDHGIAHSIYFRDPDGHKLEITTYDVTAA